LFTMGRRIVREYRVLRKRFARRLSESEFLQILHQDLGIHQGATVFVHSSVDAMNPDFPPHRVIAHLMDAVGPEGTLLFPCTHLAEGAESFYAGGGIFDVTRSATTSGLLPELARRRKDAFRSVHPTHSVVAIGKHARMMIESHGNSVRPFGEHSPYFMLIHFDSLVIGLGVDTGAMTFVHCVEDLMAERFPVRTYKDELLSAQVRDRTGSLREIKSLIHGDQADRRNAKRYVRRYVPREICRDIRIHGVPYFVGKPSLLIREMESLAGKGKTIYTSLPG
jgi:aminoglycoside 3-N-acetyltransferase